MTEKVTTRWELERESAELDYARYEQFTLDVGGVFAYCQPTRDDPGECQLDIEYVLHKGSPFELTSDEEASLRAAWIEELRNGA